MTDITMTSMVGEQEEDKWKKKRRKKLLLMLKGQIMPIM